MTRSAMFVKLVEVYLYASLLTQVAIASTIDLHKDGGHEYLRRLHSGIPRLMVGILSQAMSLPEVCLEEGDLGDKANEFAEFMISGAKNKPPEWFPAV